jgi:dipeptidyl aminopeptidase/acylaminoacyl peptidase
VIISLFEVVLFNLLCYIRAMRILLFFITLLCSTAVDGQSKKNIDVDAYYKWKTITSSSISTLGHIVTYQEKSYRGNDSLFIHQRENWDNPIVVGRVSNPNIDYNEKFVAFHLVNDYDSVRKLKLDDVPKKDWIKDTIAILSLENDTTYKFEQAKKYTIGEEGGDWILIEREDGFSLNKEEDKKKKCFFKKHKKEVKDPLKNKGSILTLVNSNDWSNQDIEGVTASSLSYFGNSYAYVHSYSYNDTIDSAALYVFSNNKIKEIFSIQGEILQPTFNRYGTKLAFKASGDTGKYKRHDLYLLDIETNLVNVVADSVSGFLKSYQALDADAKLSFSRDGKKLYYQIGIKSEEPPKDTLTDDEKYKLDLWSWSDGKLQPQQLLSAKKDVKGLIDVVYRIPENISYVLKDTSAHALSFVNHKNSDYAMLRVQDSYLKEMTWDFWYYDLYRVDLNTGKKDLMLEKFHGWDAYLSPNGKVLCYFEPVDSNWYAKDLTNNVVTNLTKDIPAKFYRRHHDVAQKIGAAGDLDWTTDESTIILQSQFDLWLISMDGKSPIRLTNGKEQDLAYHFARMEKDEYFVDLTKPIYATYVNDVSKSEGLVKIEKGEVTPMLSLDAKILNISKAKSSNDVVYQYMTFEHYPDLYLTDLSFDESKKISDANPQQKDYNWGTVEMIKWKDYRGDSIRGLLYKPENFDPTKKYPMIVYFYERYTNNIHYYYRPKTTASIIYATEYVSNGYLVFIPDITYEIGKPAQGAYNSIMSGTDYLVRNNSFSDSSNLGLQGQSWGGYQTAQMVTMTNRFACGMAGAPVSNMFSAYGGMRWGSGLSRTFQYETGQSRIGATIWEKPELYIENSPLFHLPKVETPLLIMHNDGDGAVPWYQGIELFNGLRRLDKPTWLLNYNGDEHNLMKEGNRMDLSIRMRQFFDHYLLDEDAPEWMIEGLPAVYKGKENRY